MSKHIVDQALELDPLLRQTDSPESGALVVFAGTVRMHNDGREVTAINYSAYVPLAEKTMDEIEQETLRRFDILSCEIRHRTGDMEIGDMSVVVVVRAEHRAAAFEAGRYAIDTVKHQVPIWKYEAYADGGHAYVRGCALHQEPGSEAAAKREVVAP